jgi:DNA adenine methylase
MKQLTQPLKWHGGKGAFCGKLAKWIIGLMPPHIHYVEPFFGGGSVLLHKNPEGVSEVVNDIHSNLIGFWRTLQDDESFAEFKRKVEVIPFSMDEFDDAELSDSDLEKHPVDSAVGFFIRARQSRQGLMKVFATLSRNRTRRAMNEQVASWLTAVEGLPDIHARLKRVVILNQPALDVIKQQDGQNTCMYLDPPYLHETRSTTGDYAHEMDETQHTKLLNALAGVKGKILLSGYRSNLYDMFAAEHGWSRHDFAIVNNASSTATKETKTECLWTNFQEEPSPSPRTGPSLYDES